MFANKPVWAELAVLSAHEPKPLAQAWDAAKVEGAWLDGTCAPQIFGAPLRDLAAAGAITNRFKLGTSVASALTRPPQQFRRLSRPTIWYRTGKGGAFPPTHCRGIL